MKRKTLFLFTIVVLLLISLQCKKIDTGSKENVSSVMALNEIPAEYGKLIAVTTVDQYPHWAQLWFEDEQNTIRMVRVQWTQKLMHQEVLTIQRD